MPSESGMPPHLSSSRTSCTGCCCAGASASSVRRRDPHAQRGGIIKGRRIQGKLPCWEVRVAGVDNVRAFAEAVPMWGPRGQVLVQALESATGRHRGSQHGYLSLERDGASAEHISVQRGVSPSFVARVLEVPAEKAAAACARCSAHHATPPRSAERACRGARRRLPARRCWASRSVSSSVRRGAARRGRRGPSTSRSTSCTTWSPTTSSSTTARPRSNKQSSTSCTGTGISREGSLIDVGVEAGLVRKAGAWYTYEGDQLGQGKENARAFLRDNPDLANELEKRILEKLGVGPQVDVPAEGEDLSDEPIGVDDF